ncbi:flagellar biosynthesis protein FlhA [Tautonia plasticadhaerens]|uniref:Flagellar biosynthesis protein FlhA n=1 Tax=Tautonia plasticadhaerens TaxID=2527974 RepID=A0A518HCW7_9BACT|nr:flagellar biosynthesis protein FlhA [Tautonia plasticadhaerens]QDV38680.1 Flagellar biosynthesis protein FlhA [Tautonia plasticadhaerens]
MPASPHRMIALGRSTIVDAALPVAIVGAVLVLIVPVPPGALDLLLAGNIALAVVVLLTTLAIRTPLEFSAFPTILLTTALTRLVLNVATTRLILTRGGTEGLDAAGGVVQAFGEFVSGDEVIVGAVIFLILVAIQFLVITKGAGRIGEVAARFMLDGMPGKQMAIDADLHAGAIDAAEAARRRDGVQRQADFFAAMDGAGKFVRGDAMAGVVITAINIVGGLAIGVIRFEMAPLEAVEVFTKLTIGDGLVAQVPAFLTSLAAGLIVTRSSGESDLGRDVVGQLLGRPEVMTVSAVSIGLLAFTGLPAVPLLTVAAGLGAGAYVASRSKPLGEAAGSEPTAPEPTTRHEAPTPSAPAPSGTLAEGMSERMEDLLHVDPLELEIGFRLIALADPTRGGDLLDRIRTVRHRVARELGLIVPQVRIRDEMGLPPHDYRIKIRGAVVGQGTAFVGRLLAVPPAGLTGPQVHGRDGVDPATGRPAVWIHADGREPAERAGCRIVEPSASIAEHFGEIVARHADELMTHEQVYRLLDRARETSPALVIEVVPGMLRAGEVQRVLQNLLRERVSVRDLETILEALAEHAGRTRDTDDLTECVRRALGRRIAQQYLGLDGRLRVVSVDAPLDARLVAAAREEDRPTEALGEDSARGVVRAVADGVAAAVAGGVHPVILCSAEARPVLKDLTRADLPRLVVLSRREVPRDTPIEVIGTVVEQDPPEGPVPPVPAPASGIPSILRGPHAPISTRAPADPRRGTAAGEGRSTDAR